MAPNLADATHERAQGMMESNQFTDTQTAAAVGCSTRSIRTIRANLRCFGTTRAPRNVVGRPRTITPPMLDALCDRLIERPEMYQDELVAFLAAEFDVKVTRMSVSRALASIGWSKKTTRRVAEERNADLRDLYSHALSEFHSYHLVYIDESGCDKRAGFRRTGWSPQGVAPVQTARFHRGRRYQILPAYTQDGIMLSRIFQGFTDKP
ncbi:hypothetical protein PG991_009095 [Apiospora marii]|uniref:Winged helix-turn helix domain-containing protein n=1 Tax=Apiospora marii TaxID=335849 RepID=A0ABR1RJQ3_9PEZI